MTELFPIDLDNSDFDIDVTPVIVEDYDGFDIDFSLSIDLSYND